MESYGDFEVIEEIGQGGFGTVYKTRETNTNELFAIKVPTEDFQEEFSREIVGIRGLVHKNIIGFRGDYITSDGIPYLVMEYASEGSLEDKLINGPINYNEAVNIAIELLNGLEYAHSKGVIHCDIKPGNILFNKGVSKLSDFGLYKSVNQEKSRLLQSLVSKDRKRIHKTRWSSGSKGAEQYHSFLGGTMNYTAPEHWEGLVDPRNDLYSLGIVLYQMITGRFPSLKPASKLVEEVPEQLDNILERSIELIDERYESAKEFRIDLEEILSNKVQTNIKTMYAPIGSMEKNKILLDGLVYAARNEIYLYREEEDVLIAERDDWVKALCSHNGKLYDAGRYGKIYKTLDNKIVAKRDDWVKALCSHNGKLYDAGRYGKIYKTLDNKIVAKRDDWVKALCSHNGTLYDAGWNGRIFETEKNIIVAKRRGLVTALCTHKGKLYDAGYYNKIFETEKNKIVAERRGLVTALCTHKGKLYDVGFYGIVETETRNVIVETDKLITAMCSINPELVKQILGNR